MKLPGVYILIQKIQINGHRNNTLFGNIEENNLRNKINKVTTLLYIYTRSTYISMCITNINLTNRTSSIVRFNDKVNFPVLPIKYIIGQFA